MAKRKKKYKFITEEQLDDYNRLSSDELLERMINKYKDLSDAKKSKKENSYLKELQQEVDEYKKKNTTEEIESAKKEYEVLKAARDEEIGDAIEELAEIKGGFNDAIKANKEHVDFLLSRLAQPDLFRDN